MPSLVAKRSLLHIIMTISSAWWFTLLFCSLSIPISISAPIDDQQQPLYIFNGEIIRGPEAGRIAAVKAKVDQIEKLSQAKAEKEALLGRLRGSSSQAAGRRIADGNDVNACHDDASVTNFNE
jgi:hypothetical protein